ncbi:uncharacterized protein LOC125231590 isoform X2 [Leguminivora glycinivorella]|uniref:uncharacterized protein LOC125231590 isoform X2 n=1 Tax=Leguminivora glycinivorella TaxID=1035111 RepID=UPI00200C8227|nr:uncharacterized protein LOC125231590 isoform X2 [Leguminivora glycinivorella]
MEKEHQPDSMATITMKPEYPPSEYSASEPPPAYRQRQSSSVQIARIAALTVVAASFILGSFILASSWISARASCHQLEQLDAMLDKELALEGRAYGNDALVADEPLPIANAHALHGVPPAVSTAEAPRAPTASQTKEDALNQAESKVDEDKLQKIDDVNPKFDAPNSEGAEDSSESDSSAEDDEDLDAVRPMFKLPIQFDLDELAGAFLANNQKGRMNCVVERRREDPMERRFPFNILGAFAPRAAQAERIAIICHGGDEPRAMNFPDPQSQVFAFPLSGPVRLPLRPQPERPAPEPRMPFAPMGPQHRGPFPLPMPWDSSEEQTGAPQMRIHVQRVFAIPAPQNMPQDNMGPFAPPPPPQQQDQNEQPTVLHQFVPQPAPTQELEQPEVQKANMEGSPVNLHWGLTPEDIHVIHRTAEDAAANQRQTQMDNDMQEVNMEGSPVNLHWDLTPEDIHVIHRTAEDAAAAANQRQTQMDNDMQEVKTIVNTLAAAAEAEAEAEAQEEQRRQAEAQSAPAQDAPALPPRAPRTLLLPQDMPMEERPHYMQPRSVRSVDALMQPEKRVKRCACSCA